MRYRKICTFLGILFVLVLVFTSYIISPISIFNSSNKNNFVEFEFSFFSVYIEEENAWRLLEKLLTKTKGNENFSNLSNNFKIEDKCSWWPKKFKNKKYYFGVPHQIYFDSDVTSWCYKLENKTIPNEVLMDFLSLSLLNGEFKELCNTINCEERNIIRVWDFKEWDDDVDLVVTANVITTLDLNDELSKEVFNTNVDLINYAILNSNFHDMFKYYEPRVVGYYLVYFYDVNYQSFLTNESRQVLEEYIKRNYNDLLSSNLTSS